MAELPVNADQWNAVSAKEREMIITDLRAADSLKADDQVLPKPDVAPVTDKTTLEPLVNPFGLLTGLCKIACDAAAVTALAACAAKTAGAGLAVCVALVEAARSKCHEACDD